MRRATFCKDLHAKQPVLSEFGALTYVTKQQMFAHFHIDTQHRLATSIDAPQPHVSQILCVYKHFACEMVRSAQELFAFEKVAAQGMSSKKIAGGEDTSFDTLYGTPHRHRQHHGHTQYPPSRNGLHGPQMAMGSISALPRSESGHPCGIDADLEVSRQRCGWRV